MTQDHQPLTVIQKQLNYENNIYLFLHMITKHRTEHLENGNFILFFQIRFL